MTTAANKILAALLRKAADAIEHGDTSQLDALADMTPATLFYKKTIFTPTPRTITRPTAPRVMRENDVSRPADIQRAEVRRAMLPVDEKGNRFMAADVKYLRRFARLPMPTRRMWVGRHEYFTQAARTFARFGMLIKKGRANGWAAGFTLADRLAFADQFDPKTLAPNAPSRTTPPTQNHVTR